MHEEKIDSGVQTVSLHYAGVTHAAGAVPIDRILILLQEFCTASPDTMIHSRCRDLSKIIVCPIFKNDRLTWGTSSTSRVSSHQLHFSCLNRVKNSWRYLIIWQKFYAWNRWGLFFSQGCMTWIGPYMRMPSTLLPARWFVFLIAPGPSNGISVCVLANKQSSNINCFGINNFAYNQAVRKA